MISVLSGHSHSRSGRAGRHFKKKKTSTAIGDYNPLGGNFYKTPMSNLDGKRKDRNTMMDIGMGN